MCSKFPKLNQEPKIESEEHTSCKPKPTSSRPDPCHFFQRQLTGCRVPVLLPFAVFLFPFFRDLPFCRALCPLQGLSTFFFLSTIIFPFVISCRSSSLQDFCIGSLPWVGLTDTGCLGLQALFAHTCHRLESTTQVVTQLAKKKQQSQKKIQAFAVWRASI